MLNLFIGLYLLLSVFNLNILACKSLTSSSHDTLCLSLQNRNTENNQNMNDKIINGSVDRLGYINIIKKINIKKMKKSLVLLSLLFIGCAKPDCDEELAKLYAQRNDAFSRCGDSFPCLRKIQADFDKKEKDILNNCK